MTTHAVRGMSVPVIAEYILDRLQAAERGKAAIVKYVINLGHPKTDGAINSNRNFRSHSFNEFEFAVGRGGIG